jgi:hypothetical protein
MIQALMPEGYRLHGIAGMVVFVVAGVWTQTRREQKAPANAATRLELSGTGMRVGQGAAEVFVGWGQFSACLESEKVLVLHDQTKTIAYILPKRIFPDDQWIAWLRDVAHGSQAKRAGVEARAALEESDADVLRVEYRLGYWSMVDLLQASWMGKGVMLGWLGIHAFGISAALADPMPDAKVSFWQLIFCFELPVIIVGSFLLLLMTAARCWLQHRRELTQWRVEMGEGALRLISRGGEWIASWESFNRFKETPWHFILWRRPGGMWLMIPKRALGGKAGVRRCRGLLERRLQRSTWLTAY